MFEFFELYIGGFRVDFLGWLPLSCASLDVTDASGVIISTNGFALDTICECREVIGSFFVRFSL